MGGAFVSSANQSLAASMEDKRKKRQIIEFPFDMGWYRAQSKTKFQSLQHRKGRDDFKHEFLVFDLEGGSKCRVERTGDHNARFNALSTQGCIAYDYIQCFGPDPKEIAKAKLAMDDESDLVAEIIFPDSVNLDLMNVLRICQAIHSDEASRNYTLQGYNCYFFALAIQCCLTRLVAGWENMRLNYTWHSALQTSIESLPNKYQDLLGAQSLLRAAFALGPNRGASLKEYLPQVQFGLEESLDVTLDADHLGSALNSALWHSDLNSVPLRLVQEGIKSAMTLILTEQLSVSPYPVEDHDSEHESSRRDCILALLELLSESRDPRLDSKNHWSYLRCARTVGSVSYKKFCDALVRSVFYKKFRDALQPSGEKSRPVQAGSPEQATKDPATKSDAETEVPASRSEKPSSSPKAQTPQPEGQMPEEQDLRSKQMLGQEVPKLGQEVPEPGQEVPEPGQEVQKPDPEAQTQNSEAQKSHSEAQSAETAHRDITTTQTEQDLTLRQWLSIFRGHFQALLCSIPMLLWILWRRLFLSIDKLDQQLEDMAHEFEQSRPTSTRLKKRCEDVRKLRKNARGNWENQPWSDVKEAIVKQLPSISIFEQKRRGKLKFRLSVDEELRDIQVSEFQAHIQVRIEEQARLVEKVGLGSADTIRTELRNKLSQVWSLSCDVAGIVTQLAKHGCPDLTWKLDTMEGLHSKMVGSSSSKIWKGALLDGTTVAVRVKRLHQHSSREQLKHMTLVDHGGVNYKHHDWDEIRRENIVQPWGMAILFDRSIATVWPAPPTNQDNIPSYLEKHPDTNRLEMCIQVASGLAYLHTIPLIHGKLQADSVYVEDKIAKIGNFGEARLPGKPDTHSSDTKDNLVNSEKWTAPEILQDSDHRSLETDIHDLGTTILQIITARISVREIEESDMAKAIKSLGERGKDLEHLLNDCWDGNPKKRPTAFEVLRRLKGELSMKEGLPMKGPDGVSTGNRRPWQRQIPSA